MVSPRGLSANLLNQIVAVEGIVTRTSLVRPKVIESVLYCESAPEEKRVTSRMHADMSEIKRDKFSINVLPQQNEEGQRYVVEVGLSRYKDFQRFTIQEMPECAPTGQLPRAVEVVVEEDLVDNVKPGDRVRVYAVYRSVPLKAGAKASDSAKAFLVANNIQLLRADAKAPEFTPQEIRTIEEIAERKDAFELLSRSVAPAICGNDLVKRGLLLQLLGGTQRTCDNGMRLRGDIHVMLIGDPSCGKSQMLRFMMNIAPLALSTTGRGSSGVGLTAAVTVDQDTGERRLEAGAMVLADGGLVCIDEFDKMSDEDRVAIHEVMEQQTVTISKAGIQTSLNARCSVVAAANPIYGNFDGERDLKAQVNFPDSLLSRFDLIYVVRDAQTAEEDRKICQQVLRQLQTKQTHTHTKFTRQGQETRQGVLAIADFVHTQQNSDQNVWQQNFKADGEAVLSVNFLQKYIYFCKHTDSPPKLTDEAANEISNFYADLRQRIMRTNENSQKVLTVPTPRTLEACIRLSAAHAKLKLHTHITKEDVRVAKALLLYADKIEMDGESDGEGEDMEELESEIVKKKNNKKNKNNDKDMGNHNSPKSTKKKRGRKSMAGGEDDEEASSLADSMEEMSLDEGASRTSKKRQKKNTNVSPQKNTHTHTRTQKKNDKPAAGSTSGLSAARLRELMKLLSSVREKSFSGEDNIELDVLFEASNSTNPSFAREEFERGLAQLADDNKLMMVNQAVWFI